jgi:hypothetical protein
VQLDADPDKPFSWPLYLAAARMKHRCDACVLVVTIDERVASWARQPVSLGPGSGTFQPIVLGPSAVPHAGPSTTPELAVLSALAHGADEPEAVRVAVRSIGAMGQDRAEAYFDLPKYHLGAALDRALEAIMTTSERRYLSDFANGYFDKGKAEGEAKGKAEGEAEGKAEGLRAALGTVLSARGLALSDAGRAQITSCTDVATLTRWLARAATVPSEADVFAESSKG